MYGELEPVVYYRRRCPQHAWPEFERLISDSKRLLSAAPLTVVARVWLYPLIVLSLASAPPRDLVYFYAFQSSGHSNQFTVSAKKEMQCASPNTGILWTAIVEVPYLHPLHLVCVR
jgi:hypothetical protein